MTTPITFPIPDRFGGGDLVMRTGWARRRWRTGGARLAACSARSGLPLR